MRIELSFAKFQIICEFKNNKNAEELAKGEASWQQFLWNKKTEILGNFSGTTLRVLIILNLV